MASEPDALAERVSSVVTRNPQVFASISSQPRPANSNSTQEIALLNSEFPQLSRRARCTVPESIRKRGSRLCKRNMDLVTCPARLPLPSRCPSSRPRRSSPVLQSSLTLVLPSSPVLARPSSIARPPTLSPVHPPSSAACPPSSVPGPCEGRRPRPTWEAPMSRDSPVAAGPRPFNISYSLPYTQIRCSKYVALIVWTLSMYIQIASK